MFKILKNLPEYLLALYILMGYPIHIDTLSIELSILYFTSWLIKILQNDVFLSLTLHCLPKYCLWSAVAHLVEHLTGDRRVAGLNLRAHGVTVLCP